MAEPTVTTHVSRSPAEPGPADRGQAVTLLQEADGR